MRALRGFCSVLELWPLCDLVDLKAKGGVVRVLDRPIGPKGLDFSANARSIKGLCEVYHLPPKISSVSVATRHRW